MILIVGLGNPGKKFQKTRHNIGSRIIDELESLNLENVILVKPQTFMNESGRAVKRLVKSYKLEVESLLVIHDDIDLPLGRIRISKGSGSAGHKGVESIIEKLGTKNFIRIRIGIQPQEGKPKKADAFVLKNFTKNEGKILDEIIKKSAEAVKMLLEEGLEAAMNKYNR